MSGFTELGLSGLLQVSQDVCRQVLSSVSDEHIANAICWAIGQPEDVDINEILVRPTSQKM